MSKRRRGLREQGRLLQAIAREKQRSLPQPGVVQQRKATRIPRSPYHPHHRLLLLGEGNFSFAHSLIAAPPSRAFTPLPPSHIIATCYDSFQQTIDKYPVHHPHPPPSYHLPHLHPPLTLSPLCSPSPQDAQQHLDALRAAGVEVWDRVDCTRLHLDAAHFPSPSPFPPFDFAVFNFPHTGQHHPDPALNSLHHRTLLTSFLTSVLSSPLFHPDLTVHLTVKTGEPYTSWRIPSLLPSTSPLTLRSTLPFHPSIYPLYTHRRTRGWREEDGRGEDNGDIDGGAVTYEWGMRGAKRRNGRGEGEVVGRGGTEEEEVEEERRRLQEEVRRVVSRYDTTGETTLPALDAEQPTVDEGQGDAERQGSPTAVRGLGQSNKPSPAGQQLPSTEQVEGVAKHQRAVAVAAAAAAARSSRPTSSSAPPATATPWLAPLPPRPQRKAPKLRQLLF